MLDIIDKISITDMLYNSSTIEYMKNCNMNSYRRQTQERYETVAHILNCLRYVIASKLCGFI